MKIVTLLFLFLVFVLVYLSLISWSSVVFSNFGYFLCHFQQSRDLHRLSYTQQPSFCYCFDYFFATILSVVRQVNLNPLVLSEKSS